MASKKKQKDMVFHHEGASTPAAAPAADHPPPCFVVPKPGKASEGGMERNSHMTQDGGGMVRKSNMYPSKEATRTSGGLPGARHPTGSNPHSDNLSPDSTCKGIRVTLDNNSMWNEFFRCKTEMILTKQGSRMFPYCRFRISGLQPSRKYSLIMDIQPVDNSRYKWTGKSWQVAGKAECHIKSQPFAHPESPSTGQHWMQSPVSFYKLKLTNNISDQEGNTTLHPMHRYLPRLHLVQTDKAAKDIKLNDPSVVTFTFPQTEFMAVTAYQNSQFAQLKVDYNPFAKGLKEDGSSSWGLKLKSNSDKDSHEDGGTTANKQHPVKKSLKSLLENHKPKSSKVADSKPSASGDLKTNSTPVKDQPAAKVPAESLCCNPAQKLFSELIREAHVSLQRCNLEQLSINNSTSYRNELTNVKSNQEDAPETDVISVRAHSETSSAKKSETVLTKRNIKEDKLPLCLRDCKDNVQADHSEEHHVVAPPVVSQSSSAVAGHQPKPKTSSEVNVKQHRRPAPLPLPALALFLKQHSTKSKKAKSRPDSPPPTLPSGSGSGSQKSAAASDHAGNATGPSKDLTGDVVKSDQASGCTTADVHQGEMVLNASGPTALQPSSPSCLDALLITDPKAPRADDHFMPVRVPENSALDPAVADGTPVLKHSDQPLFTHGILTSTISSTIATSSSSRVLSPTLNTVLPALNSPQTPPESSTLPSDTLTTKSDSLLPDPECSSFGFEPLSPASSPEPLPPLPASLAFELDSTTSEPTLKTVPSEELMQSENSAASVFKWHTVLPPPQPYIDPSFTTFQPPSQTLSLGSITSPLLPSLTPSHSQPQTLDTSTSTPPPDPAPSFQENEQSLPFPAELSPLVLQLPLSPTFSSLDGDGLSPPPSISDLVHFFSTNDDLGMGVEFSNPETVAVTCPPLSTVDTNLQEPPQPVQPIPANKPCKRRKKSRLRNLAKVDVDQKTDDSTYTSMQPNLEEVEEQLFISFTSKEALKLHIADSSEGTVTHSQTTPEGHLPHPVETPENAESMEQSISACEKLLLRDLKLMKHKQVIHPVLQEVGLKMNLLDPTLAIDLQYLGVLLPIPPPGVSLEPLTQELPPSQGVSAVFVSRTGKTTDVTQIKGWREKFTPSEAPSAPPSAKPEAAGPSSDPPKKNLSAFCSDMLDEYLESEGKLIDERAASFSQPLVEPVVYELPTRSTSYVRTLDNVVKKHGAGSPTSDLISGFVPPSKRPRLTLKEKRTFRKGERKQRGPKQNKLRAEPAAAPVSTPEPSPAESNLAPNQPAVVTPAVPPPSDHTEPLTFSLQTPTFKKRKKLKPKTSSQTLTPSRSTAPLLGFSEDLAPLESDSELGTSAGQRVETSKDSRPVITRALLRQKDLEDGVVWEGRPRTSITEERATVALTSLFTLMGFVSENPTAPIQLTQRRAPPCLNEFCRLGCVCSSLSHCSRISHCGRLQCMFGCSCLKQKVVLLKNLDGSDSSPSHHGNAKKRKRKRRMKMAYILKEADSVSQPAERVRILWKRGGEDSDPDPIHVPKPASLHCSTEGRGNYSSCARVRGYTENQKSQKQKATEDVTSKAARLKPLRRAGMKETKSRLSCPPAGEPARSPSPSPEPIPKPSKRLIILAECKWASDADRNHVLKKLCEAMAQDRLDEPFWIRKYLIKPISQTVEESCVQYKIHISRPRVEREKPARLAQQQQGNHREQNSQQQDHLRQEVEVDWPREVREEELLEDWQREVEEGDIQEEEGSALGQVDDGRKRSGEKVQRKKKKRKRKVHTALPFLTGISPAGFLSADRKQSGGTDHLVQVNGKFYPLAKIQLGKMGALHPANRLAAYLTGRVGSSRKPQGSASLSSASCKPPQTQSSGLTHQTASSLNLTATSTAATTPSKPQPPHGLLAFPTSTAAPQPAATDQSAAAACHHPAGDVPEGARKRVIAVKVFPSPVVGGGQVRVAPVASLSAASQVSCSAGSAVAPGPQAKVPVLGLAPRPPAPPSAGQRMFLQPVQTTSGIQYYRMPDGKLVQLVPVSKLRPVVTNPPVGKVLPRSSLQAPPVPVVDQTPPQASVTAPSPLSGLRSFSVPPLPAPLRPGSGVLPQKGKCALKILPASNKDTIIITCPKLPSLPPPKVVTAPKSFTLLPPPSAATTPVNLVPFKPSAGPGAELRLKTVAASAGPTGQGGAKPAPSQTSTTPRAPEEKTPSAPPPRPPPEPELAPLPLPFLPADAEPACDPVDLDIICVDDETDVVTMATTQTVDPDPTGTSSGETENSSDFEEESCSEEEKEPSVMNQRHIHNWLERRRRVRLRQLFGALREEAGLKDERASKLSTLQTAVQMIEELRATEADLKARKRRLMKKRDEYLSLIAPATGKSWRAIGEESVSGRRADVDEPTDEDVSIEEGEVRSVAMETMENGSRLDVGQRKVAKMMKTSDRSSLSANVTVGAENFTATFRDLGSSSEILLLEQACQQIQNLQTGMETSKGLKVRLNQQRGASTSQRSGEQRVPRKLHHLSSKRKKMEEQEKKQTAERPAAGGGASDLPAEDSDVIVMATSNRQRQTPQAPPTLVSAPPTAAPAQRPQTVLQASTPAPPAVSHNASVARDRPRTIPNILSRRKKPAPPSTLLAKTVEGESPSFQALVPAEVLSLVSAALPGQRVLTLSPLMAGPTVLQTTTTPGVASVTLNVPGLTNQQLHLTSLPGPPPGKIYSSSAPLAVTNFTDLNSLLHLVQPAMTQQQQVSAGQPPPPPAMVSDQTKDQDRAPSRTDARPESSSSSTSPSARDPSASADCRVEVRAGGPETGRDGDAESLTSLVDEIVFLNQQTVATAPRERVSSGADASVGGAKEQRRSPCLLQLDLDCEDGVAGKTGGAKRTGPQTGPDNGNTKGGVLAPPPLLQMKVGGAKPTDASSSDRAVETIGGGRAEGGVAWRPMPRLVPLGLRGNRADITAPD